MAFVSSRFHLLTVDLLIRGLFRTGAASPTGGGTSGCAVPGHRVTGAPCSASTRPQSAHMVAATPQVQRHPSSGVRDRGAFAAQSSPEWCQPIRALPPPPYAARSPRQARSATAPTAPRPGRRPQVAAQRCRAPARPNADPPCQRLHLGSHLASAHSRATAEPQQPLAAESGRRASHLRALLRAMGAAPSRRYSESVWARSRVRHTSCMPDRPTPRTEGIGERLERGASASASVGRLACAAPNRRQDVDLRGVLGDLTHQPRRGELAIDGELQAAALCVGSREPAGLQH